MGHDRKDGRYRVVFLGAAKRDFQLVDQLVENLQRVFGLSLAAVTYMMRMVPFTVKRDATLEEALRYKKIFESIGGKVALERAEEPRSHPGARRPFYGFSGTGEKIPIRVKYPEDGPRAYAV